MVNYSTVPPKKPGSIPLNLKGINTNPLGFNSSTVQSVKTNGIRIPLLPKFNNVAPLAGASVNKPSVPLGGSSVMPKPITPTSIAAPVSPPSVFSAAPVSQGQNLTNTQNAYQSAGLLPPTAPVSTPQTAPQPQVPTYQPPEYVNQFNSAYQSILGNLAPSTEEEATQTQLDNLLTSRDLGINEYRNKPIPMELITGTSEYLTNQAAIKAQPLKDKLAILQARRQASLDASKTGLEAAKFNYEVTKPVEVGGQLVQRAGDGSYQSIFGSPKLEKLDTQIADIGGRKVLVNTQTGQTIADLGSGSEGIDSNKLLTVTEAQTLGVPYGTTVGQAMGMGTIPTKPATQAQETTSLYANRIEQANSIFDQLEPYMSSLGTIEFFAQQKLPNFAKSDNFQSYEQAARNFINAVLRRESGAVISPGEFDNAAKQYFPQPGDSQQVLAQKKQNRMQVQQGFIQGAGQAYQPSQFLVQSGVAQKIQQAQQAGYGAGQIITQLLQPTSGVRDQVLEAQRNGYTPQQIIDFLKKANGATGTSGNANKKEVVAGYDITSYATDPRHGASVKTIYERIPTIANASHVDRYIQSVAPGSPVKGQDVINASRQYSVDPKVMLAIMQQDSTFGTKGKATTTYNPGNVGNTDDGSTMNFGSWANGVLAVARNLSKRKLS